MKNIYNVLSIIGVFNNSITYYERLKHSMTSEISFVKLYTAHRYLKKFSTDLLKLASRRKAPNYMRKLDTSDLTQFYLQGAPRTNKCGSLPSSPSSMSISKTPAMASGRTRPVAILLNSREPF